MADTCFYFGVWEKGEAGHFLVAPSRRSARYDGVLPFASHILDSHLLPPGSDTETNQGHVYCSVINGWTVLTFWDRSGDSRPASNSAFILPGEYTVAAGLTIARKMFPSIFARFPFELKEAYFHG